MPDCLEIESERKCRLIMTVPASISSRNQSAATLSSPGARVQSLGKKVRPRASVEPVPGPGLSRDIKIVSDKKT